MHLGCIADDYTGATDLAASLSESGMRVAQLFGQPEADTPPPTGVDAIVVALKIRNRTSTVAVAQAKAVSDWLVDASAEMLLFKYCSTFDSTAAGNIGPVHDALMTAVNQRQSISTPSTPLNGRTVYQGHLFVGSQLLSDTGMRNHPLTPMTDSSLLRVLSSQTPSDIRLLPLSVVREGAKQIEAYLEQLHHSATGRQIVVCDAVDDADLEAIARASNGMRVVAGAAGLGRAIASTTFGGSGSAKLPAAVRAAAEGPAVVLAGSCSTATLAQVDAMGARYPIFRLGAEELADHPDRVQEALEWAAARAPSSPVIVAASQPAEQVARAQERLGVAKAAELVESALSAVAAGLKERGVRKLIVAGGETSGAVVDALGVRQVRIGPPLAAGVPWIYTEEADPMLLALKSGNFGTDNFFLDAVQGGADARRRTAKRVP